MTAASFFGCLLVAYGPAVGAFAVTAYQSGELAILMICSAFFWLLSILIASGLWFAGSESTKRNFFFNLGISVALQEAARVLFWYIIRIPEIGLTKISGVPQSLNRLKFSYVSGLGFGFMSGLVMFVTQLANSSDPGIIVCQSCPSHDMFFISALTTCLFIFLHTTWGILVFDSLWRKTYWQILYAVASHFGASYSTTLVPSNVQGGCWYALLTLLLVLVLNLGLCFVTVVAREKKQA
ncbi:gamma-secretase subunit Aph-1 [Chytriomyces sp. MP71]|nr:gamma-secretase subunit Aph-1 [Chytriomyces sp. MP71]